MRLRRFLIAAVAVGWLVAPARSEEFPYTAYVNAEDVYIRSGPGKNYYPTDKLRHGEAVEVYRHDPGGWLAIRPPLNSFSWVSSRHIDVGEDGVGTVNRDRAMARVGSAFSDMRDSIQVHLNAGEKVELMSSTSGSAWYKIAPPSGEFRWIHSKYVDRELQDDDAAALGDGAREPEDADDAANETSARAVLLTAGRGVATEKHARTSTTQATSGVRKASGISNNRDASDAARPRLVALQEEMNQIEIDLSAMVAEELSVWTFDELRRRAEAVLDRSQTAVERGRARLILSKIDRFDTLKQRHDTIVDTQTDTNRRNQALGVSNSAPTSSGYQRYDGTGRLSPVVSKRTGAPQFALVDESSRAVKAFVTPAPGVNLRSFVGKQVGITGPSSYLPDLQSQHINAQRVTLIDSGTLRR